VSNLEQMLRRMIDCFERLGLPYVVMGGLAVRIHALPRPTYDVDFTLSIPRSDLYKLFDAVQDMGLTVPSQYLSGWVDEVADMPLVKFRTFLADGKGIDVDVFLAETDFQTNVMNNRLSVDLDGKPIWVVKPEDLLLLKLLASRPRDLIDVADLIFIQGQLNEPYLHDWANKLNINDRLEKALAPSP